MSTNIWGEDVLDSKEYSDEDSVISRDVIDTTDLFQQNNSSQTSTGSVLMLYGLGAELGNFEIFAKALKKNIQSTYDPNNIKIVKTTTRLEFFDAILNSGLNEIKELHVFSHAFGAGLALGYHDQALNRDRGQLVNNNPNYTYDDVITTEIGCLLTDHLIVTLLSDKTAVQTMLQDLSFIKIWGCNSEVANWVYGGDYWEKLNDQNTPKPSIAKALAEYTNKKVWGAMSGSHIEYFIKGKWVSGYDYPKIYNRKYPKTNEYTDIRLHPDRGSYIEFLP